MRGVDTSPAQLANAAKLLCDSLPNLEFGHMIELVEEQSSDDAGQSLLEEMRALR